jgi:hypothetical protein
VFGDVAEVGFSAGSDKDDDVEAIVLGLGDPLTVDGSAAASQR